MRRLVAFRRTVVVCDTLRAVSETSPLACPSCGGWVVPGRELGRELPLCDDCFERLPGGLSQTFTVRTPSGQSSLDGAGVVERLRAGQLLGSDWLIADNGSHVMIAAHPAFSTLFVQGLIPEPVPVVVPPPAVGPGHGVALPARTKASLLWGAVRVTAAAGVLAALGAAALWGWANQSAIEEQMQNTVTAVAEPAETRPREPALPPPPPQPKLLDALVARVGAVGEPRATLLARAWGARLAGGAKGETEALAIAERAVARSPKDPESLGLLAEVLAGLRRDGPLVDELISECELAAPVADACARAKAAKIIAGGDLAAARGVIQDCAGKGDFPCRALYVATANPDGLYASESLAAVDKLALEWPQNRELARKGAILAAGLDLPESTARVDAIRAEIQGDIPLETVHARLLLLDGRSKDAASVVAAMGEAAPVDIRVAVAAAAAASGRGPEAQSLLGTLHTASGVEPAVQAQARLAWAQAAYFAAAADPAQLDAAKAAILSLVELGRADPAVAQVRALVAHLYGNHGEEVKAWSSLDESKRPGAALARALNTQVRLGVEANLPVSELIPLAERARRADPQAGETHLWLARVHLVGGNAPQAVDILRASVLVVDGQQFRRRADLGTLPNPLPTAEVLDGLKQGIGSDATFGRSYELARATVHYLAGNFAEARRELEAAGNVEDDPDSLALRARVRASGKDVGLAVADWERVVRERPKEPAYLLGYLQALVAANRVRDAAPFLDSVSSSPLTTPQVLVVRGEVRAALGEQAAALRDFQDAIARDPFDVQSRLRHRRLATAK